LHALLRGRPNPRALRLAHADHAVRPRPRGAVLRLPACRRSHAGAMALRRPLQRTSRPQAAKLESVCGGRHALRQTLPRRDNRFR